MRFEFVLHKVTTNAADILDRVEEWPTEIVEQQSSSVSAIMSVESTV